MSETARGRSESCPTGVGRVGFVRCRRGVDPGRRGRPAARIGRGSLGGVSGAVRASRGARVSSVVERRVADAGHACGREMRALGSRCGGDRGRRTSVERRPGSRDDGVGEGAVRQSSRHWSTKRARSPITTRAASRSDIDLDRPRRSRQRAVSGAAAADRRPPARRFGRRRGAIDVRRATRSRAMREIVEASARDRRASWRRPGFGNIRVCGRREVSEPPVCGRAGAARAPESGEDPGGNCVRRQA